MHDGTAGEDQLFQRCAMRRDEVDLPIVGNSPIAKCERFEMRKLQIAGLPSWVDTPIVLAMKCQMGKLGLQWLQPCCVQLDIEESVSMVDMHIPFRAGIVAPRSDQKMQLPKLDGQLSKVWPSGLTVVLQMPDR